MAVTVIERPLGHKLSTSPISASVSDDSGDALFTSFAHGLSDQYVYIESNIDSYNGFWYVQSGFGVDSFKLLPNDEATDFVQFKQVTDLFYYVSDNDHGWQCVHLPIVYELESDLYPVNSIDTVISIAAYGFVNGYFAVTHSALTGSDELFALDYVRLDDGSIVQVVEIVSSTITVLNSDGTYIGFTMQKVRNNYHADVNVYAGLPIGHRWESEKPYELATTLRFIPDSNNQIKFSIAEILKGYITTRNNLTLDTLPNNIDFMTAFYIEFTEGYDISNGTEITAFIDEFEEDDFEGYAVNAMLPFKNIYSGFMSQYIDTSGELARWLTTMDVPIIFVGFFFDISFINKHDGDIKINKNGVLYLTIPNPGIGVLRVPVEAESGDTELCIQACTELLVVYNLNSFSGGEDWSLGPEPSIVLGSLTTSSELSQTISLPDGLYEFYWNIFVTGNDGLFTVEYKKSGVIVGSIVNQLVTAGSNISNTAITLTDDADELVFYISSTLGPPESTGEYLINALSVAGNVLITESICLRVVSECDTFIADDLRLIETGPFRELE